MKPTCAQPVFKDMTAMLAMLALLAPDKTFTFERVEAGATSVLKDAGPIVIRTPEEFSRYMDRRKETGRRKPKIDWKLNQLLAIHLGSVPSAGYGVEVQRLVQKSPGKITAEVALIRPPADMLTASVISYPYTVVKTPKFSGTVDVKLIRAGARGPLEF